MINAQVSMPLWQKRLTAKLNQIAPYSTPVRNALAVLGQSPVDIGQASQFIALDPIISASALRLANSAFYGFPRQITTIREAAILLGAHTLKQLIISLSFIKLFPVGAADGLDRNALWRHSIDVAMTAKILAREVGVEPDAAFTAGLLHDIGQFILAQSFPDKYAAALQYQRETQCSLEDAELHQMRVCHCQAGAFAMEFWKLPDDLFEVCLRHHAPAPAELPENPMVDLIHVADILAKRLREDAAGGSASLPSISEGSLERLDADWQAFEGGLSEIASLTDEACKWLLSPSG